MIRNFDIQCNKYSKIEDTWWWPYTAETYSEEEGWLDNEMHIRWKYMWNKWYIDAKGYLNSILGPQSCDICCILLCRGKWISTFAFAKKMKLKSIRSGQMFCSNSQGDVQNLQSVTGQPTTWYDSITRPLIQHRLNWNQNIYSHDSLHILQWATVISDIHLIFVTKK
jgi:hypothetical protein